MASRISKKEWLVVLLVTAIVDFIQLVVIEGVLVWFFGIGAGINEVLDPIVGIIFTVYLMWRRVPIFSHYKRLIAIFGVEAAEELSFGVAQAWVFAAWYIRGDVLAEEGELEGAESAAAAVVSRAKAQPLNKDGRRERDAQMSIEEFNEIMNKKRQERGQLTNDEYFKKLIKRSKKTDMTIEEYNEILKKRAQEESSPDDEMSLAA